MITERHIVDLAAAYGTLVGISLKTVSSRVLADGKVLPRIDAGRGSMTMVRAERAWQWFDDHWPVDAPWPTDIGRPTPSRSSTDAGQEACVATSIEAC